jgi:fluoride exporter
MGVHAIFLVFVGGGLGAVGRFAVGLAFAGFVSFPLGTLVVNVLGSLAIGFLAHALPPTVEGGAAWRSFLITGMLGGFTTFSAFSLETMQLAERGEGTMALIYVVASVLLSLGAAGLGWSAGRLF